MSAAVLVTDRLVMREWRDSDKAPYADMCADPEVMEHFPATLTAQQSSEMVDSMVASWEERGFGLWACERRDSGEFVGYVGLSSPRYQAHFTPCVEVGWRLARSHWGHGFAPEAGAAALQWGFTHLVLPDDRIVSFTTTRNLNSQRVMQKLGLTHDARDDFDHPLLPDWPDRRHVLYQITRDQWRGMTR
jgi:RimJ/RimL family protein N-acetyltransferase